VNRLLQATIMFLLGLLAIRLFVTDEYLRFVKPSLGPWLLVVGVALLGLVALVELVRPGSSGPVPDSGDGETAGHGHGLGDDGHGHDHGHGPRVGLLLFLPVLTVFVVSPPALGAYSAERTPSRPPTKQEAGAPLPEKGSNGYRRTTLGEYAARTYYDTTPSYADEPVRLVGFVLPRKEGGWYLARISIACCAADGSPTKVFVRAPADMTPPAETWVAVEGRGIGTLSPELEGRAFAEVQAERVIPVEAPTATYE